MISTLYIGARALRIFSEAMQTTSHNIANVNTPGYSRQRVQLRAVSPEDKRDAFLIGRGVDLVNIERLRDSFLDLQARAESAHLGEAEPKTQAYRSMESIFHEPSDTGLAASLNDYWSAWQEVSNNPTDLAVRANLRAKATTLTAGFRRLHSDLNGLQKQTDSQLVAEANQFNSLAKQVYDLNRQINGYVTAGTVPNDLYDHRDLLLTQMSKMADVYLDERVDGRVFVQLNGHPVISETGFDTLDVKGQNNGFSDLTWKSDGDSLIVNRGTLKGILDTRDTVIGGYIDQINTLASGIISQVNTLHRQGLGLDGTTKITGARELVGGLGGGGTFTLNGEAITVATGDNLPTIASKINLETADTHIVASVSGNRLVLTPQSGYTIDVDSDGDGILRRLGIVNDFFAGSNAADIDISDGIKADVRAIAASRNGAPGDNNNALNIAALANTLLLANGTVGFDNFYQSIVTQLGAESQAAQAVQKNQENLLAQIDAEQQQVAGVSLDEEATKMMELQHAYQAAAALIRTADEMMQTLLEIKR